jgi:hypothetical protein
MQAACSHKIRDSEAIVAANEPSLANERFVPAALLSEKT